jgi:hypothetical protein
MTCRDKTSASHFPSPVKLLCWILLFACLGCRNSFLSTSATPIFHLSASEELQYLAQTDKDDWRQTFLRSYFMPGNKKVATRKLRDQARMKRVQELYDQDSVRTDDEKFIAGLIFLHGCPNRRLDDTNDYVFSYNLFSQLAQSGNTSGIKTNAKIYKKIAWSHLDELKKRFYIGRPEPIPVRPHGR